MNASPHLTAEHEIEQIYQQAVARLEKELGWTPQQAHSVIAELAAAYGVFLHDVARAVLAAPSVKQGLTRALRQVPFDRRPLELRQQPAR